MKWIQGEKPMRIRLNGGNPSDWIDLEPNPEKKNEILDIEEIISREGRVYCVVIKTRVKTFLMFEPYNMEKLFITPL